MYCILNGTCELDNKGGTFLIQTDVSSWLFVRLYDEHLSSEFIHSKLNGTLLRFLLCLLRLKTSTVDSSTVEVEGNGNTQVIILEAYILLFIVLVSASEPKYHMSKKHFKKGFI